MRDSAACGDISPGNTHENIDMAKQRNGRGPVTASVYVPGCVAPIVVHRNGRDLWQDGRKLTIHHNKASGYAYTNIRVFAGNGKTKHLTYCVHKLVALAFLGRKAPDQEVDHINRNRADNRASNLRWVSHRQNMNRPGTRRAISDKVSQGYGSRQRYDGVFVVYDPEWRNDPSPNVQHFASVKEASSFTGVHESLIYKILKHRYGFKSASGYCFYSDAAWDRKDIIDDTDVLDELDLYDPEHPDYDPLPAFATA